jgi:hypothetical protein
MSNLRIVFIRYSGAYRRSLLGRDETPSDKTPCASLGYGQRKASWQNTPQSFLSESTAAINEGPNRWAIKDSIQNISLVSSLQHRCDLSQANMLGNREIAVQNRGLGGYLWGERRGKIPQPVKFPFVQRNEPALSSLNNRQGSEAVMFDLENRVWIIEWIRLASQRHGIGNQHSKIYQPDACRYHLIAVQALVILDAVIPASLRIRNLQPLSRFF